MNADLPGTTCEHSVLIVSAKESRHEALVALLQEADCDTQVISSFSEVHTACTERLFEAVVIDDEAGKDSVKAHFEKLFSQRPLRRTPVFLIHPDSDSPPPEDLAPFCENVHLIQAPVRPHLLYVKLTTVLRMRELRQEEASYESRLASQNVELERLAKQFNRELNEARAIRRGILPQKLPESETVRFAAVSKHLDDVGGDIYDVWCIRDNVWGVFLGDVTGVGLPAAFLGAMTKMARRFSESDRPEQILDEMNRGMMPHLSLERYVTALAGVYDANEHQLRIASGGHPPAFLYSAKRCGVEAIRPAGAALGVSLETAYEVFETSTAPGDKLLLISDGVTETVNMDGEKLGVNAVRDRLEAVAGSNSLDQCIAEVLATQEQFTAGRLLRDDSTVVGLEVL